MLYRIARPAPAAWNVAKTLLQLVLFWCLFLIVIPIAISTIEIDLGIQRFPSPMTFASVLLFASTAISLWAAITMAVAGHGTPAPFDTARELVVRGPYAYVRNPFVVASVGQAAGLALALGSVPLLLYATVVMVAWYFFVRRREERYLAERFGARWHEYRRNVRGFRPRLTPYIPVR